MNRELSHPTGLGYLVVHATTARGAIPLEGARVHIKQGNDNLDEANGDVLYSAVTGRDGNTEKIPLYAPPRADSQSPQAAGSYQRPYGSYHVDVYLEGYYNQSYFDVPVFDGITSVQNSDMIPLPENGRPDGAAPDDQRFFESAAPNLT